MQVRQIMRFALTGALMMLVGTISVAPTNADPGTVVTDTELDQAMAGRADKEAASREAMLSWLDRDDVGKAAAQAGLDLERVKASVSVLSADELREVEAQARIAGPSLSGGDDKIVIGTTALIIILLVVIILVAN